MEAVAVFVIVVTPLLAQFRVCYDCEQQGEVCVTASSSVIAARAYVEVAPGKWSEEGIMSRVAVYTALLSILIGFGSPARETLRIEREEGFGKKICLTVQHHFDEEQRVREWWTDRLADGAGAVWVAAKSLIESP
jgi:hypothetical protein